MVKHGLEPYIPVQGWTVTRRLRKATQTNRDFDF